MKDPLSHHRAIKRVSDYEAIGTVEEFARLKREDELRKAEHTVSICRYPNEVCANMILICGKVYCDSIPCSIRDEV